MSYESALEKNAVAMETLAAAMNNYAEKIQKMVDMGVTLICDSSDPNVVKIGNTGPIPGTAAGEVSEKPATKRRTKAEIAADAKIEAAKLRAEAASEAGLDDEDPFGDDPAAAEEPVVITADDIRKLVMGVKAKTDQETALAVIRDVGAKTLSTIPEKDYPKVVAACAKHGVKL